MKPLPMRPMRSFGFVMSEVLIDDEIGVEAPRKEVEHVLDGRHSHPFRRLLGQTGDMGCEKNLVECEERMILCGRLVVEYVETRGGDPPLYQRGSERGFIDDTATCGVDDANAGLHERELLGAENWPPCLRHMHRDHVRPGEPTGQRRDWGGRPIRPSLFDEERIERARLHPEALRHTRQ